MACQGYWHRLAPDMAVAWDFVWMFASLGTACEPSESFVDDL